MANFKPLKKYLLLLIDGLVEKYSMTGPFLDVGCGRGDISLHFANKGWIGKAVDVSCEAVDFAKMTLKDNMDKVIVECKNYSEIEGKYNTILLCDFLEHIEKDDEVLESIRKNAYKGANGSRLIVAVPVFRKEWRWDDDFYGHVRRYEISELVELLKRHGFEVEEIWDFTFPFFWLIRRIYTRIFPRKIILKESRSSLSTKSALHSSWDRGIFTTIFEKVIWWKPVFYIQSKFKKQLKGCECVLVAKYI